MQILRSLAPPGETHYFFLSVPVSNNATVPLNCWTGSTNSDPLEWKQAHVV